VTYRSGLIYDLRGNGKTALKVTFNKYLRGQTLNLLGTGSESGQHDGDDREPSLERREQQFHPGLRAAQLAANGECLGISNPLFGSAARSATFDDILMKGWGNRETNWELSAGAQHELLPARVGRRRVLPSNLEELPRDRRSRAGGDGLRHLQPDRAIRRQTPGGGGYTLGGLVALRPEAFGRPALNNNTLDRTYGTELEHWNGFDFTLDARLPNGLTLQVGSSTGKTMEDDCEIVSKVPEMLNISIPNPGNLSVVPPTGTPAAWRSREHCHRQTPWLTQFQDVRRLHGAARRRAIERHVPQYSRRSTESRLQREQCLPGGELDARSSTRWRRRQHHDRSRGAYTGVPAAAERARHALRKAPARRPRAIDPERRRLQTC
jgi:hypothetical protein